MLNIGSESRQFHVNDYILLRWYKLVYADNNYFAERRVPLSKCENFATIEVGLYDTDYSFWVVSYGLSTKKYLPGVQLRTGHKRKYHFNKKLLTKRVKLGIHLKSYLLLDYILVSGFLFKNLSLTISHGTWSRIYILMP